MPNDFFKRIKRAVATGPDMRNPKTVGVEGYVPPAAGLAHARLVGYFEIGKHKELNMQQKEVLHDKVDLIFELSGPNHPPRKLQDGTLVPHRITVKETLDLSEPASFFKLFEQMNYAGTATHMVELLYEAFIVEVFHRKGKEGKTYASLKGPNGYNVKSTSVQDPISGKTVTVKVGPPTTEAKFFVWHSAEAEDWYSLYIPGEYEAVRDAAGNVIATARSRNVIQERIIAAANWAEHPLASRVTLGGGPG